MPAPIGTQAFSTAQPLKVLRGSRRFARGKICIVRKFQLLLILIEDIVRRIKNKTVFTMKIEPMACNWIFVCAMNVWAARNGKKLSIWLLRPNLREFGLFHPCFVCKCSFREIQMLKIIIFDQSKRISQIFISQHLTA